jgi:hypothetical protein
MPFLQQSQVVLSKILHLVHPCGGMVVPTNFALISYHLFFAFPLLYLGKCRDLIFNITLFSLSSCRKISVQTFMKRIFVIFAIVVTRAYAVMNT